jgi:hypothetical protein
LIAHSFGETADHAADEGSLDELRNPTVAAGP